MYDRQGNHQGGHDPETGNLRNGKEPDPGRNPTYQWFDVQNLLNSFSVPFAPGAPAPTMPAMPIFESMPTPIFEPMPVFEPMPTLIIP